MLFRRSGISFADWIRTWICVIVASFFSQASPVSAQDPLQSDIGSLVVEPFGQEVFREGYVTIRWSGVDAPGGYRVTDEDGRLVYAGRQPQFFVSGLSDGQHAFQVTAVDQEGRVVAKSEQPVSVRVEHWPLAYAFWAFGTGLTVVVVFVAVIVWGHRATRTRATRTRATGTRATGTRVGGDAS
ncbi:hypothetical protein [Crateriforma conspicua]|uniref:hypothetical protein n=1 Tax=Crateriforma TaxID=2714592 RepID=UPI0018CF512F|nr:hypothetical protein [Crateriforma conspicua]